MTDKIEAIESVVPWKGEGNYDPEKRLWILECAFCDYTTEFKRKEWAEQDMRFHAKPLHYDRHSGLYKNAAGLEASRERHAKYKQIMGDEETTRQMNREGL